MPAAAVIPALLVYSNVVAVKKLVVEIKIYYYIRHFLKGSIVSFRILSFTVNKLKCSKQAKA